MEASNCIESITRFSESLERLTEIIAGSERAARKKERIRPLKTPQQVRQYIRRQAWYSSFKELVMTEWGRSLWECIRTLWGYDGAATITNAFDWDKTVQGHKHWQIVDECFTAWYVGK